MPHAEMTLAVRTNGAYTPRVKLTAAGLVQWLGPPLDLSPAHLTAVLDHLKTMAELMHALGFTGMRVEE